MQRAIKPVFLAFLLSLAFTSVVRAQGCSDESVDLRYQKGSARFSVEIAADADSRAVGLMNRDSLPRTAGMLFIYEEPVDPVFWMKNVNFSLDMLFADATGTVTHIHHMAKPYDETHIPGGRDVQFVLEINGGMAEALAIETGAEMRHPMINQSNAAWPCDEGTE